VGGFRPLSNAQFEAAIPAFMERMMVFADIKASARSVTPFPHLLGLQQ
jgi:hypothetical protein